MQLEQVEHDYIRYANVWEDARLLIEGLRPVAGKKHLSIASAGDNALMLLTTDPELVVAVDINAAQLNLCALKCAAIQTLNRADYLAFIGFTASGNRQAVFEKIRPLLSESADAYWLKNIENIEQGAIHAGKFERYFRLFAHRILPFIHSKSKTEKLFEPKSPNSQAAFYHEKWNTWRWRWLFKIFFSKYFMGKMGRDPAFLKQVSVNVGGFIFEKAAVQLSSQQAQNNFILRYNLTGNFGSTLPDYVQEGNYEKIKARISRLVLHEGFAESAIEKYGKFDYFNLSDIFEYMDLPTFRTVAEGLLAGANPHARFAYWNLMVPRNMANLLPNQLTFEKNLSETLTQSDRGFFYNAFIINELTSYATEPS
jgi:S-adenosylmethionine-diacylglycerol 3-amino-3-carboxypropyl transferase